MSELLERLLMTVLADLVVETLTHQAEALHAFAAEALADLEDRGIAEAELALRLDEAADRLE